MYIVTWEYWSVDHVVVFLTVQLFVGWCWAGGTTGQWLCLELKGAGSASGLELLAGAWGTPCGMGAVNVPTRVQRFWQQ